MKEDQHPSSANDEVILSCRSVNIYYGKAAAVKNLNIDFYKNRITSVIGPSGCGKSTLLRAINRMNDFIPGHKMEGEIIFNNRNIYEANVDPVWIRLQIGMVFESPNPFPASVYDNITLAPRLNGYRGNYDELVYDALEAASLWDDVKDRLHADALTLSLGEKQRLCVARALAMMPDLLLLDEPTSSLDPNASRQLEDLILKLRERVSVIMVTHNLKQAARISDYTAFLHKGSMIEYETTFQIFTQPSKDMTEEYIMGKFHPSPQSS